MTYKILWTRAGSSLLISLLKKLNQFSLASLKKTGDIDVKMDGSVLEKNSSFIKIMGLTFSSKLDWGSSIFSIAKTASKKNRALIRSMKFLPPEVALYPYLELLGKLQKQICRTVGPSLAASLEPLAHHWNVDSFSLFCRYYFGRCSSKLAWMAPFLFLKGRLVIILIDCMIFLSPLLDVTRMST